MIIKCLLLHIFFFIVPTICMSQGGVTHYVEDVDGHPVDRLLDDGKTVEYITLEGQKVIAYIAHGVEFNAGKDSLDNYVKRFYYNQEGYDNVELNQRIVFSILFDKNLNIIEVRQLPPHFLRKEECYKKLFIDILNNTTGMWHKTIEHKEWYVYWYVTRLF